MENEQINMYVGAKIKSFRKNAKLNQQELAKKIGVGKTTISNYEVGIRSPKKAQLIKLAELFKVSIDDFFPTTDNLQSDDINDDSFSTLQKINELSKKLLPNQQEKVLDYVVTQLNVQKNTAKEDYKNFNIRGIEASKNGQWHDENIIMDMQLPTNLIPDNYNDIVIILGDSMRPHLEHGEILFIQTDNKKANLEIEEGQLGLFNTSEGIFIKKYRHHYLESLNSEFKHVFFKDDDQLKTLGVVVKTIKNNTYN
ncbi:XRE family transcriptional regulator [Lactococcus petauri]|uniref:XRE family transcriptional regulator n=1 Tax=Lactococcus petauri TaxID=1940789 RepID=UPI001F5A86E6|nr:XRE family transcriptional regulator [Lactococcus petauri]